jgi:hypothetical protein
MSLKKVQQVKNSKEFHLLDLLVYGVILLVIAALFLGVSFIKSDPILGIQILYNRDVVLTYDFDEGKLNIPTEGEAHIGNVVETNQTITLTFYGQSEKQYNQVTIDKSNRTAYVTEANCNRFENKRECVHMDKVQNTSDIILCTPHAMRILAIGYTSPDDFYTPPSGPNLG